MYTKNRNTYEYKYYKYKKLYHKLVGGVIDDDVKLRIYENLKRTTKRERDYVNKKVEVMEITLFSPEGNIKIIIDKTDNTLTVKKKIKEYYFKNTGITNIKNIEIYSEGNENSIRNDSIFINSTPPYFYLITQEEDQESVKRSQEDYERKREEKKRKEVEAVIKQKQEEITKRKLEEDNQQKIQIIKNDRTHGFNSTDPFGPELRYLNGVNLFYYYPNIYGRKVLLLGEEHIPGGWDKCNEVDGCMNINTYISNLIDIKRGCIDFYLEDRYPNVMSGGSESSVKLDLDTTRNYWDSKIISNPNIPYLRLHKWDLRLDHKGKITTPWNSVYNSIKKQDVSNITKWIRDKNKTIDYLLENVARYTICRKINGIDIDLVHEFILHICKIDLNQFPGKITWNIMYDKNRKKIKKAVDKLSETIDVDSDILINKFIEYWIITIKKHIDNNIPEDIIGDFGLLTTDLYLLSRIFTTFKYDTDNKRDRTPVGCGDEYSFPKNIILFGGKNHIKFIKGMIHILYPEILEPMSDDVDMSGNKCIELNRPTQFF